MNNRIPVLAVTRLKQIQIGHNGHGFAMRIFNK